MRKKYSDIEKPDKVTTDKKKIMLHTQVIKIAHNRKKIEERKWEI